MLFDLQFSFRDSWCSNGRRSNKCCDASWVNNVKAMRFILALPKQLTQPTLFIEQDCVSHANLPQVFVDTLTKARKGKLKIKHINSDITVGGEQQNKNEKETKGSKWVGETAHIHQGTPKSSFLILLAFCFVKTTPADVHHLPSLCCCV